MALMPEITQIILESGKKAARDGSLAFDQSVHFRYGMNQLDIPFPKTD